MNYSDIPLHESLQKALAREGYTQPTPIQEQAIPRALAGADLIGIAQTGTGKTAAFSLPILHRLQSTYHAPISKKPRALILAPTRELAAQILVSLQTYGRNTKLRFTAIYGGVGQNPQVSAMQKGIDVLVATPGRLLDLINQRHIFLDEVEFLVLDEADRMLDMGFAKDMKKIIDMIPKKRQTLLFSATMSQTVDRFSKPILNNPERVEVAPQATTADRVDQRVLFVDTDKKNELLLHLLQEEHLDKVLVFVKTKHRANKLAALLSKDKIKAKAIHGDKSQNQRIQALKSFATGNCRVLVGTDVAARGLDIDDISHVINYDLPLDTENYVHRIGRTARAGAEGVAYSFASPEDKALLNQIQQVIGQEIPNMHHEYHSEKARNAPPKKISRGGSGKKRSGNKSRSRPRYSRRQR